MAAGRGEQGSEGAAWSLRYLQRRWSGSQLPRAAQHARGCPHRSIRLFQRSYRSWKTSVVTSNSSFFTVRAAGPVLPALGLFSIVLFDGKYLHAHFQPDTLGARVDQARNDERARSPSLSRYWLRTVDHGRGSGPPTVGGNRALARSLSPRPSKQIGRAARRDHAAESGSFRETPAATLEASLGTKVSIVIVAG